ncbi:MAG: T9SS type A sorting domain-containing protein, partial [Schleiferiaceae bacterium]|nr:T9SS type A sorting domain-containing protein [Schleiferiaceae bacterium]
NANTWYQIWRQTTVGGGFSLLDSTQNLTYVDTPAAILFGLDYKIAIGGTCFSAKTNTISIDEESLLDEVVMSPVPFNDHINIQLPSELDSDKISTRLLDLSGKEITNIEIVKESNKLTMSNLKDLPSGVYVLHLTAGNKAKSFKLIH